MVKCDEGFTHCNDGCWNNVTVHCCNIIHNTTRSFCYTNNDEEYGGQTWVIVVILAIVVGVIYVMRKKCPSFRECLDSACSRIHSVLSCDDCDGDKCLKCISGVILCPCLLVMWLYREWKERTSTANEENTSTQEGNTTSTSNASLAPSGPQVEYIDITLEPTAPPPPVNQTHIDISIYNGYPQSSSTDSNYASNVISPSDISVSPPSYEEVTRNDPPSYADAHKYPIDKS